MIQQLQLLKGNEKSLSSSRGEAVPFSEKAVENTSGAKNELNTSSAKVKDSGDGKVVCEEPSAPRLLQKQ